MKKDFIFAPALLLIGVLLCLLSWTGMPVHIVLSVVGALALGAYSVLTRKEWKILALEIGMRACYGVALITGIIVINVQGVAPLAIIHRVFCILFLVSLAALIVIKLLENKKKD